MSGDGWRCRQVLSALQDAHCDYDWKGAGSRVGCSQFCAADLQVSLCRKPMLW